MESLTLPLALYAVLVIPSHARTNSITRASHSTLAAVFVGIGQRFTDAVLGEGGELLGDLCRGAGQRCPRRIPRLPRWCHPKRHMLLDCPRVTPCGARTRHTSHRAARHRPPWLSDQVSQQSHASACWATSRCM